MQVFKDYGVDSLKDIKRIRTNRNIMHEALERGDVKAIGYNHNG